MAATVARPMAALRMLLPSREFLVWTTAEYPAFSRQGNEAGRGTAPRPARRGLGVNLDKFGRRFGCWAGRQERARPDKTARTDREFQCPSSTASPTCSPIF